MRGRYGLLGNVFYLMASSEARLFAQNRASRQAWPGLPAAGKENHSCDTSEMDYTLYSSLSPLVLKCIASWFDFTPQMADCCKATHNVP